MDLGTVVLLLLSALFIVFVMRVGVALLASFSRSVPEPPPAGELRRVRLNYRCEVCGAEMRMTLANDEVPDPPRHCMEEMELQAVEE